MRLRLLLSLALLAAGTAPAFSAPLENAKISHALNEVRVVGRSAGTQPAGRQEVPGDGPAFVTGRQSRAELTFQDGTLARIGAETVLRLKPGTRDLLLERGTLLLQVPKFRGGAKIQTGPLVASLGGATVLLEHLPGQSVKIVVLEGDLRIAVKRFLGDSIVLAPGKMLITKPDVRLIPDPVDVDVRTLVRSSSLIDPALFAGPVARLPSMPLIERTIARQDGWVKSRQLFPTNLAILGSGSTVVIPQAQAPAPTAGQAPAAPVRAGVAAAGTAVGRDGVLESDLPKP